MKHTTGRTSACLITTGKRQKGATALQFGLVFPVFFAVLYAGLMYGFIFLAQMGLQHAAADGVREALRFQDNVVYPSPDEDDTLQDIALQRRLALLQARIEAAKTAANSQASWMEGWAPPIVEAAICPASAECNPTPATSATPDCSALTTTCQIVVTVTYPYGDTPIIPALPGLHLLAPAQLQGSAQTLFNGKTLSTL